MPDVTLLQTVPGVGLITATALVASVGDIRRFRSGRHFASYLGPTPKEDSATMHRRLGAISKQGDAYLRMLLIHGARSLLCHAKACANPSALQHWALQTQQRRGHNIAAVAVANKLARIVWAVWHEQRRCHDAPRASRPHRLRRCAARSLDPCSRRGLTAPMRRRTPSSPQATKNGLLAGVFLIDGGVQIRPVSQLVCYQGITDVGTGKTRSSSPTPRS